MNAAHEQTESTGASLMFFSGLFTGAVIGASLGVLFAPRQGAALREQIAASTASARTNATKVMQGVAGHGRDLYGRAREAVSREATTARAGASDGSVE